MLGKPCDSAMGIEEEREKEKGWKFLKGNGKKSHRLPNLESGAKSHGRGAFL